MKKFAAAITGHHHHNHNGKDAEAHKGGTDAGQDNVDNGKGDPAQKTPCSSSVVTSKAPTPEPPNTDEPTNVMDIDSAPPAPPPSETINPQTQPPDNVKGPDPEPKPEPPKPDTKPVVEPIEDSKPHEETPAAAPAAIAPREVPTPAHKPQPRRADTVRVDDASKKRTQALETEVLRLQDLVRQRDAAAQQSARKIRQTEEGLRLSRDQVQQIASQASHFQAVSRTLQTTCDSKEHEVRLLKSDLESIREEHASLRAHLQLHETQEPAQISSEFNAINRAVDTVCRNISEAIVSVGNFAMEEPTTLQAVNRDQLAKLIGVTTLPSLVESKDGQGRPLEEFLDFCLRSIINTHIYDMIFTPFHPFFRTSTSDKSSAEFVSSLYQRTRLAESQAVAGKWRSTTFAAIQDMTPQGFAEGYIKSITTILVQSKIEPLLLSIYGPAPNTPAPAPPLTPTPAHTLSTTHIAQISHTLSLAYAWNAKVKSSTILLDFHPRHAPFGAPFDTTMMDYFEKPKKKKKQAGEILILSGVTLGLQSSKAVGGGEEPQFIWQEKIKVLTDEFFQ